MFRKLIVLALTATTLALVVGVGRASADTIVLYKAAPDLVVTSLTPTSVTVKNVPHPSYPITAAAGPFTVRLTSVRIAHGAFGTWWFAQNPTQYFSVASLEPGATATFTSSYYIDVSAEAKVDFFEHVAERDETNNTRYEGFWI